MSKAFVKGRGKGQRPKKWIKGERRSIRWTPKPAPYGHVPSMLRSLHAKHAADVREGE